MSSSALQHNAAIVSSSSVRRNCSSFAGASPARKLPWHCKPVPVTETDTSPSCSDVRVIRFSVSVPVLSVRMMLAAPSVSTADRRAISAFLFDMRHMPRASAIVATNGRPSGIAATASAIPTWMARSVSRPTSAPAATSSAAIRSTAHARRTASASRRRSSGVTWGFAAVTSCAILPSSVDNPVATTTAVAAPRVTAEPLNSMLLRSANGVAAGNGCVPLATGTDSPVSVDSSAWSFDDSITRRSAVTTSPPSSRRPA